MKHISLHQIEETGWMPQLQNVLRIAGAAVDLLDAQGSSVILCLEDGWDFTTQVETTKWACLLWTI